MAEGIIDPVSGRRLDRGRRVLAPGRPVGSGFRHDRHAHPLRGRAAERPAVERGIPERLARFLVEYDDWWREVDS